MLAYLVSHPDLMDAVRSEMASAFDSPGCVNFHYLNDSCPQLGAIWNETLRMTASSTSVRYLIADTVIGGKTLRKNNRVMIPSRQLHFNEEVFGRDAHQFDPDRFIRNKALLKGSSWRPFGGGTTICPGRFGWSLLQRKGKPDAYMLISCETSCVDHDSDPAAPIRCGSC